MARRFMMYPLKCNILILLIISFYSCSTTRQAEFHQLHQIAPPPHKTTPPAKTTVKKDSAKIAPQAKKIVKKDSAKIAPQSKELVKKADAPVLQKNKIASANQGKEKTLPRKPISQAEFNFILENRTKNKHDITSSESEAKETEVVQENDEDALMSEYLFQHSFGYSFGTPDNSTEEIKSEMIASGFDFCCEKSDKNPYNNKDDSVKADSVEADSSDDWQFYSKYSEKWGLELDGTEDKQLIMAIDEWLGTNYKWGGCSKYSGVDCSCLVKSIYEEVYGIELSRSSSSIYFNDLIPVKKEDLQEGDLICFKGKRNRISHIGLYLKDDKFVHSSRSKGVTIDDLNSGYYKKIFFSGGRVSEKSRMSLKMSKHFSDNK